MKTLQPNPSNFERRGGNPFAFVGWLISAYRPQGNMD